jgi:hypothetical protein
VLAAHRGSRWWPEPGFIDDRTFEIEFLEPGVEAYCFTFG